MSMPMRDASSSQSKIYLRASLARLVELFDECRERRRDGRRERVILVP